VAYRRHLTLECHIPGKSQSTYRQPRGVSLLPKSSRLRRILLAYTVNELGTWFGYVALALGVYDHTHSALATAGLFIARGLLPALLAPVLVTRVERFDKRGMLAGLYGIEALLTLALAALLWRFSFPGVLIFVAIDGTVAVAATALVRASAARAAAATVEAATNGSKTGGENDVVAEAQRQANAALNVAFMVSLWLGPAIGGVLVHWLGGPIALVLDAVSFMLCAMLMLGLRTQVDGADGSTLSRLRAAWQHLRAVPALRVLLVTEAVAVVVFASVEPVEVVYAKSSLHAGDLGFGLLVAAWGFGAALGAIVFSRSVHRPLGGMLTGGAFFVGVAYLGFAAAPVLAIACIAAVIGGAGNGIQWPSFISAVQQLTPGALHGRLMSVIGSLNALCPALGFALGGTIAALTSPRIAMLVAGVVAACATVAFMRLRLGDLQSTGSEQPATNPEPGFLSSLP
jgi:MFS family permease